ncbi:MAG: hypothetical protein PHV82_00440 [Victivallaceae bacterium]|nr:hypothetical protein [Victivallaceae bacterium]
MLVYVLGGILAGVGGAWFIVRCGHNLGMIDKPNHRSSHSVATPKGGGIGILAAFLVAALAGGGRPALWIPASVLSLLSLYGDKLHLSHKLRLMVQFVCSAILICFAARHNYCAVSSSTGIPVLLIIPLFILMVTATANYYNFMDALNGIAGITGLIAFSSLAFVAGKSGIYDLTVICITVAGACCGFLFLNMTGKVFMGDGGSILLGFLFAGTAILLSETLLDVLCYFAFIYPFYADEFISIVIRLNQRQSLFKAHRGHLCQLLANELNIAHWKVAFMYGLCQLIIILLVQKLRNYGLFPVAALEILLLFLTGYCYVFVKKAIKRTQVPEVKYNEIDVRDAGRAS